LYCSIFEKLFHRTARKIDRYLDDTLPDAEREEFQRLCFEDKKLFLMLKERAELREKVSWILQARGEKILAEGIQQRRDSRWAYFGLHINPFIPGRKIGWAYGIIGVAVLSLYLLIILPHDEGAFAINDQLEKELGPRILRAATVTVLSPKLSEQIRKEVAFAWKAGDKGPFEVIIIDHSGGEIVSYQTKESSLCCSLSLPPGLYYWKLLSQDDWIYTGKFKILK
jgi:hypothetical protein